MFGMLTAAALVAADGMWMSNTYADPITDRPEAVVWIEDSQTQAFIRFQCAARTEESPNGRYVVTVSAHWRSSKSCYSCTNYPPVRYRMDQGEAIEQHWSGGGASQRPYEAGEDEEFMARLYAAEERVVVRVRGYTATFPATPDLREHIERAHEACGIEIPTL